MKKLKWCFPGWEVPCDHTPSLPHVPSPRLRPVTKLHPRVQLMSLRASQSQTVCLEGTKTPVASLLSPTRQLNKTQQLQCSPPTHLALLPAFSLSVTHQNDSRVSWQTASCSPPRLVLSTDGPLGCLGLFWFVIISLFSLSLLCKYLKHF